MYFVFKTNIQLYFHFLSFLDSRVFKFISIFFFKISSSTWSSFVLMMIFIHSTYISNYMMKIHIICWTQLEEKSNVVTWVLWFPMWHSYRFHLSFWIVKLKKKEHKMLPSIKFICFRYSDFQCETATHLLT